MREDERLIALDADAEIELLREVEAGRVLLADDQIVERLLAGRTGDGDGVLVGLYRRVLLARRQRSEQFVRVELHTRDNAPFLFNHKGGSPLRDVSLADDASGTDGHSLD